MIDVTNCPKIHDENRGVNEKLWIDVNGRPALFKKTQIREDGTHTNAHFSESLVSDICKLIGFKCAEIDIAKRGEDVGCVSYSYLKEGEETVDLIALIQNIRISFDSKKMIVTDTNEKYDIPLILEALEEESSTQEEYNNLKKEFLKSCIVDSLIEHYDRNPSNISVIRRADGITLAPMYDNGTSLSVSMPFDIVKENIEKDGWIEDLRKITKSKVGAGGEKHSNYDKLVEYILSNYYGDVKDFLDVIDKELTQENMQQILSDEKYRDLDEIYKRLVMKKISINRENLLVQSKKYESKYQIEELMGKDNAKEVLTSMTQSDKVQEILPEFKLCIDCPQRNPYHIYDVAEYMCKCIENINNIDEISKKDGIEAKLSDKDKRIIQWAILFNEMGKPQAREEQENDTGDIRDTFKNYSKYGQEIAERKMEELNFYEIEKDTIKRLIASHNRRNLDSDSSIKRFINELGEKNLDLYFAMKLAETNAKNPEVRNESIEKLSLLKERIEKIQKTDNRRLIKSLPQTGKKLIGLGLKGPQIGILQQRLAAYVRENDNMYAYYKGRGHLEKYRKELSKYAIDQAKEIKHQQKAEKLQQSVKESQNLSNEIIKLQKENQNSKG